MKIIDKFNILVKEFKKDYYANIYQISMPYILKPGDRLYRLNYENRGVIWTDVLILDVTETEIIIGEYWLYKDRIFKLKFNEEPNYSEIFGSSFRYIIPEKRKLEITPFSIFNKKPNLKKIKGWKVEDFYKDEIVKNIDDYLRNFENLVDVQISIL